MVLLHYNFKNGVRLVIQNDNNRPQDHRLFPGGIFGTYEPTEDERYIRKTNTVITTNILTGNIWFYTCCAISPMMTLKLLM